MAPSVSSGHKRKADAAAVDHLATSRVDQLGQALAAKLHRVLQALPATFDKTAERLLETCRCGHLAVAEARGVLVAFPVQRGHHPFVELGALFEHRRGRVVAGILKTRQRGHGINAGQVLHHEQHVLDGGAIGHGKSPERKKGAAMGALYGWGIRAFRRARARR
jgi:hypothetical protein